MAEACRKNERNVAALERSPGVVEFLVKVSLAHGNERIKVLV